MAAGDAVDFKYYQYTDDFGNTWSVKVDKLWGADADAGFGAADPADPFMPSNSPALRPRRIFLQDLVSGRKTSKVVGSLLADAWTTAGYDTTVKVRGAAGTVAVVKYDQRGEHIRHARTINNMPEPIAS